MYCILEHVIDEVGIGLYEVIEDLENLDVLLFFLVKSIKGHVVSVYLDGL